MAQTCRHVGISRTNGAEFQSRFHWHLEGLDIRHVNIRPRTPDLNGKVERSHRVDDEEFYQLLDHHGISDDIRLFNTKLREWEDLRQLPSSSRGSGRPDALRATHGPNES